MTRSNGDCCVKWIQMGQGSCTTDAGLPGTAYTASAAFPTWLDNIYNSETGHLYIDIGPPGPWSTPTVLGMCIAN